MTTDAGLQSVTGTRSGHSRGFSIVELMVALVLGLLVIAGVLQVFLGNRQAQRVEQSVSRVSENGRIALDLLGQDLRMAGYYGCARTLTGEINDPSSKLFNRKATNLALSVSDDFLSNSVRGYARDTGGTWGPSLPTDLNKTPFTGARNGSDLLAIYFANQTAAEIPTSAAPISGSSAITVEVPSVGTCFTQNMPVLIGNCKNVDLIRVTNTPDCSSTTLTLEHGTSGNTDAQLSGSYGVNSHLMTLAQRVYYVKATGRTSPRGDPVYSLYRYDGSSEVELIEGIEFLHVLYGEQLSSGNVRYVAANDASLNMANVVSVQVAMLAQSFDSVRTDVDTHDYTLLDETIGPTQTIKHSGGHTLRRVYTATIELRNRLE